MVLLLSLVFRNSRVFSYWLCEVWNIHDIMTICNSFSFSYRLWVSICWNIHMSLSWVLSNMSGSTVYCCSVGADTWSFVLVFLGCLYTSATPSSQGVPLSRRDLDWKPVWQILSWTKFGPWRTTCTNNQEKICIAIKNGDQIMYIPALLSTLELSSLLFGEERGRKWKKDLLDNKKHFFLISLIHSRVLSCNIHTHTSWSIPNFKIFHNLCSVWRKFTNL